MLFDQIENAARYIKGEVKRLPKTAIILGSGLKEGLSDLKINTRIKFRDIPFFPIPTVSVHGDELLYGHIGGQGLLVLTGRFHYYEGYTMEEVTFGIRVLGQLGVEKVIITNITGSVNKEFQVGELVVVRDHINLQSENPLRGNRAVDQDGKSIAPGHDQRLGPRFPSMVNAYDPDLIELAQAEASSMGIVLHNGVYTAVNGPSLETPAEYKMIHTLGGDIIGMSTVPEVIVAKQIGIKTIVLSIISNQCMPIENLKEESLEDILANMQKGIPNLARLLSGMIPKL